MEGLMHGLRGDAFAEWRRHWTVVLAGCSGYAASTMLTYSISLFLEPIQQSFGWTRVEIMSGSSIVAVVCGLLAPLVGTAVDRYGPRWIGIFGLAGLCMVIAAFGIVDGNYKLWLLLWLGYAFATVCVLPSV